MSFILSTQNPNILVDEGGKIAMADGRLSIGRGTENDLVLADPDRTLSKQHCRVEHRNGDYILIDSSTNGTFLNYSQDRLDTSPTPLSNGDVIIVGDIELIVQIGGDTANVATSSAVVDVAPMPEMDVLTQPSLLPEMTEPGSDFLDDLLGDLPDPSVAADPGLDPFAAPPSTGLSDGSSAPNHTASVQDQFQAPSLNGAEIPEDWAGSFIQPMPHTPPTQPTAPMAAPTPAPMPVQSPAPAPAAPTPTPPTSASAQNAGLQAFLKGIGAETITIPPHEADDTLERMGRVMAAMITGMREILMTRAALKSEMRMTRTLINAGGNNPLKFSISPEQAIEAMIHPSVAGYVSAEMAVTEALNDVKAHEVATMSGMQAALNDLLSRLGPEQLSARIEDSSKLGSLLGNKKARYWEAYEKLYAQIARETEDDFQSAFGQEFARAYEQQIKKL